MGKSLTCEESFETLLNVEDLICIVSNFIYVLSAILALVLFRGSARWTFGVFIILVSAVSILHHSGVTDTKKGERALSSLDILLANLLGVLLFVFIVVGMRRKQVDRRQAWTTLLIIVIAAYFFAMSSYQDSIIKDEEQGQIGGGRPGDGLFMGFEEDDEEGEDDYRVYGQRAIYLTYHSMWHVLSGVAIILAVVTLVPFFKKEKKDNSR